MAKQNLVSVLNWCALHETTFQITIKNGILHIRAGGDTLWSEWPIREGTVESVVAAMYAALYSVQAGTEFHEEYGFMPDSDAIRGRSKNKESGSGAGNGEQSEYASPDLRTDFEA